MKAFIKQLTFDKDLVKAINANPVAEGILYMQLINGRITLQEYVVAKKAH